MKMKKLLSMLIFVLVLWAGLGCAEVVRDNMAMKENMIRLHVVANSDEDADQAVKLKVRDEINGFLQEGMKNIENAQQARSYLLSKLPELEQLANAVLSAEHFSEQAQVTLTQEAFNTRFYDTFTLPSGVYHSLRIVIGEGEGHNWWCVVFPSLCIPAASEEFEDTAVSAGLSESLAATLSGQDEYEIRFFLLECLGRIENFFFEK